MPLQSWADLVKEAGDTEFNALPAADYDMKIIKSEAKKAGNGKTMFRITTEVISGPHKGRRVWHNLTVSPENPTALNIFFRQMAAIGIDKSFFATNPSDHNVAEAMLEKEFRGQVSVRQWNGQDQNEIKSFSRLARTGPDSAPLPPMSAASSPVNSPSATVGAPPAAQPSTPPPAAGSAPSVAPPPPSVEAPEPVQQAATPPVNDAQVAAPAPQNAAKTPPPAPF